MNRVFLGWDSRETVAWHVAVHSIIRRTRAPLSISPIGNANLPPDIWWRERGPHDSTEFSNARFMVPALCDYKGWALFADSDTLWLADIDALFRCADDRYAVMVVKQQYEPQAETKFLGQAQTRYPRKNWSSLMLFNCAHPTCRSLDPKYVNTAHGLELHGFGWTIEEQIGALPSGWNTLVKHERKAHAA